MGGIIGYNTGSIKSCYNKGNVIGNATAIAWVGGITGQTHSEIQDSYNIGIISSSAPENVIGGITGNEVSNFITNCYYLNTCGAAGFGTSKTTGQLKALTSTLENAYKTDSKNINEGYPILVWQ